QIARAAAPPAPLRDPVGFIVGGVGYFPFPEAGFDIVWAMESSEHFSGKGRFFRQAASSLRAGGQLFLAAWTGSMKNQRIREVARRFLCPQLWTAEEYRLSIEAAGLHL